MSSVPCRTALRCFDSFGMEETLPSITPMVVIRLSNRQDASRNDEIRTTHSSGVACERIHLYVLVNGLVGSWGKIVGRIRIILIGNIASKFKTVGDFVAVRTSRNHRVLQLSTSDVQQVQYQSIKNNRIPQSSTRFGIWFGTRGSEVQILSPRPIFFSDLQPSAENQNRPTWYWPRCSSCRIRINAALRAYRRVHDPLKIDYKARWRTLCQSTHETPAWVDIRPKRCHA